MSFSRENMVETNLLNGTSQDQDNTETSAALLEQLVYIDHLNIPDVDPTNFDDQLSAELAAFADDSFIFPDEEKPKNNGNDEPNDPATVSTIGTNTPSPLNFQRQDRGHGRQKSGTELSGLPKAVVPPGAMSSLVAAGLNQSQIDTLATLVAQYQHLPQPQQQRQQANYLQSVNPNLNERTILSLNDVFNYNSGSSNPSNRDATSTTSPISPYEQIHGVQSNGQQRRGNQTESVSSLSFNNSASVEPSSVQQGLRKSSNASSAQVPEHKYMADDDKRRRNTAASARFRIKKKMKEQAMERNIKELTENAEKLELKIQRLEMENRLLRNLVVEKGAQRDSQDLERLRRKAQLKTDNSESGASNLEPVLKQEPI
ncbi:Transcriptional activator of sulfur metabolism MET4 (Methionine-requiring protein 4) [Komagataella phaffii CBS 7435]|uniref:BZIP domain-containing protein n=2 Tax=Komagataella phaffii TaxID=460519 RepID=C4R5I7_KOMPG|nr:Hypothetical protein PAS_chr3_0771 [Komagataella phaffii GS115]AOA63903.1 GQ67_03870T0 [Komagataella phaffii]CAH2449392.1 Transcriptional activator of sulfur metabolism MET4 (Methionine-requiring protein 4) [Komagataella phaffii CBS 7435]AOA68561.1 GQ68_03844T0 [Komagataella phaffii GS115]CAY70823.1 Hypothetical protein PAS_chr3_0771 [Komagataella phaffii GS115]CCA39384.1 Transcriptional activator of sulfur metabolism MET4 (Methionine-requiring protein 4) [Komagataella phaffii CBS 7435]